MTSILVSSDDEELALDVARSVAEAVDFRHVGAELLDRVAAERQVPLEKLAEALKGSSVGRWGRKQRELLLSYVETAALEELLHDQVVCSGLAAHLYAHQVAHFLTARVVADPWARARALAASEHIPVRKAWKRLAKQDRRRTTWSVEHYGIDEVAATNHDLTISLSRIDVDKAVEMIGSMASYRKLMTTTYSQQVLRELVIASRLRNSLLLRYSQVRVQVADGNAIVWVKCSRGQSSKAVREVEEIAARVDGVDAVQAHAATRLPPRSDEPAAAAAERPGSGADPNTVG